MNISEVNLVHSWILNTLLRLSFN